MSPTTNFVRASALHGLAEFATSQNFRMDDLLKEVGLLDDVLEHPESLIPYSKFAALLTLGTKRSENPLFALRFGLHQGVSALGPLLYLIRNAGNVGAAINELSHYFHLHASIARIRLEVEGDHALLHYDPVDIKDAVSHRLTVELVVGAAMQLMRTLLGSRWQPRALLLQSAPQCDPQAYTRLIGVAPQFNASCNAWIFDAQLLDIPLSSGDQELHRLIQQHLDALSQMSVQDLPAYIQQLLRNMLPSGRATMEQIAGYMDLHPRTLQRYLAEEGTSFQMLLDETRQSMAQRYLVDSMISLTQLAAILGYSELSAFSRAFQRWFGCSPREWRAQQYPASKSRHRLRTHLHREN